VKSCCFFITRAWLWEAKRDTPLLPAAEKWLAQVPCLRAVAVGHNATAIAQLFRGALRRAVLRTDLRVVLVEDLAEDLEYFVPAQSLVHLQRSQTPVVQREQLEVPVHYHLQRR